MKTATVVGAGPSGLVAACILADQGWQVSLVERADTFGGRLRAENWDNNVAEMGPSWLHNSAHPISKALPKGGVYQSFNRKSATGFLGILDAYFTYYILTPIITRFNNRVTEVLLKYTTEVKGLSWRNLLDRAFAPHDAETPNYAKEVYDIINSPPYNWYFSMKNPAKAKRELIDMIVETGTDVDKHSTLSSQDYLGYSYASFGDDNFLPNGGYSQIIRHLENEIKTRREQGKIKILTGATVYSITGKDVHLTTDTGKLSISTDKVVVAIAKHDLSRIALDAAVNAKVLPAIDNLQPSGRAKIVMQLNKSVYLPDSKMDAECFRKKGEPLIGGCDVLAPFSSFFSITGQGFLYFTTQATSANTSPILYALADHFDLDKLGLQTDADSLGNMERKVRKLFNDDSLRITKLKVTHCDGNSWYRQHVGFEPFVNQADAPIVFLGTVTGCDDAVHAVCTRACKGLGQNPDIYLTRLFTPKPQISERREPILYAYKEAVNDVTAVKTDDKTVIMSKKSSLKLV